MNCFKLRFKFQKFRSRSILTLLLGLSLVATASGPSVPPLDGNTIKVVQCNIEDGGQFTNGDSKKVTWDTAKNFANLMASDSLSNTALIGMEEIDAHDTEVNLILDSITHRTWNAIHYEQGIDGKGSGLAIFYRPDLVALVENFGTVDVTRLDNGYIVRFGGALFRRIPTGEVFSFFTGKLAWDDDKIAGHPVNDDDRVAQAKILRNFINQKMVGHKDGSRIITMDMNATFRSKPWATFSQEFYDGMSDAATFDSHYHLWFGKRFDYIWWDLNGTSARNTQSFVDGPRRSTHFGSDHRFVWAELVLSPSL